MQPSAGPPGARISILGTTVGSLQSDCAATNWGDSDCIDSIKVGEYVCRLEQENINAVISFGAGKAVAPRYSMSNTMYRANAVVPDGTLSGKPQVSKPGAPATKGTPALPRPFARPVSSICMWAGPCRSAALLWPAILDARSSTTPAALPHSQNLTWPSPGALPHSQILTCPSLAPLQPALRAPTSLPPFPILPSAAPPPQPGVGTAGNFNVTVQFEGSLIGSFPLATRLAYSYDVTGTPYLYQQYPEVTSVSPAVGSSAGGTVVTINGRGFPDFGLDKDDTISVTVAGVPCTVINSAYDVMTCSSGAQPATPALAAAAIKGQYPGMRGADYEHIANTGAAMTFQTLWKLNAPVASGGVKPGATSYKASMMDAVEGLEFEKPGSCSRMRFFFTAPTPGAYRFYVQADEVGQLNGTWIQVPLGDSGGGRGLAQACMRATCTRMLVPGTLGAGCFDGTSCVPM